MLLFMPSVPGLSFRTLPIPKRLSKMRTLSFNFLKSRPRVSSKLISWLLNVKIDSDSESTVESGRLAAVTELS